MEGDTPGRTCLLVPRFLVLSTVLAASALVTAAARPSSRTRSSASGVPAGNWWNLDVSAAPLDSSSAAFIDFISGRRRRIPPPRDSCIPTSVRPRTDSLRGRVGRSAARPADLDGVRRRERQRRAGPSRRLSDPRRGEDAGELHRRGRRRRRTRRRSPHADRRPRHWLLFETVATALERDAGRWEAGLRRRLRHEDATIAGPTPGRRPTPPASRSFPVWCATTRRSAPARSATRSASPCASTNGYVWPASHEAGSHAGRAADGRAAAPEGVARTSRRLSRPRCSACSARCSATA